YKNCPVVSHCPKPLRQLLSNCAGIDEFVASTENLPPLDYFAPLLHIPSVLGHTPADFPTSVPYITADESLVERWREQLAAYPGRKIGLAWRGSPTHQADSMRSIPLAFVETAAVMKNLDLVIACDTAIAHVAGALGVPVWVALCNVPDWRWLASGDSTVWYPTMRLFRQSEIGQWSGVLNRIAEALAEEFPDVQKKLPADYCLATSGFNRLNRTKDGLILYDRHDPRFGRYLQRYGQYAAGEIELLEQAVQPGWTVVEAGAGPGLRTLMFSRRVGASGFVLAFEHGPLVFQTLCANMALNSVTNVRCRNELLGDAPGTMNVAPRNINRTDGKAREGEAVAAGGTSASAEPIRVIPLDSLNLPRCNLLKIDVGGMELLTLQGAKKTLEKHRPLLYVSAGHPETTPPLIEHLQSLGYQLFWHTPMLFSADNFYQNSTNEFGNAVAVYILGIHSSVATDISGLKKIDNPHSDWRG
ncbi:MAG: FkbM family methyltransferase, partial [Planctomycetia bacterium]|nr:FkbM family methyltransferase [Planctomycetia bacterium]